MPQEAEVTQILQDASGGSERAAERLLALVYGDLRRLAASYLRDERRDHTLQATELVHEAYLRLVDQKRVDWQNRAHFFAVAAQAMRRLLVDHARRRRRDKRGGDAPKVSLGEELGLAQREPRTDVLAVDQALSSLAAEEPEMARVVELRFFGGLTTKETALVLGIGQRTVERYWLYARTRLFLELNGAPEASGG